MSVLGTAKSNSQRKTHQAAQAEGFGTLPGEISAVRAAEKSAEAVVVKKGIQRQASHVEICSAYDRRCGGDVSNHAMNRYLPGERRNSERGMPSFCWMCAST
ncbi:hypothetical protein D3C84_757900 [compost metagenome]